MLAEVNSHDWDTVRWLMGSNYERVYTEVANFKGAGQPGRYAPISTTTRWSTSASRAAGWAASPGICPCGYGYDARVEIVGEKGIMQIGELQGQAVVVCTNRDQGLITPIYRTWPERFAWGYIYEMEHFVECIRTGNAAASRRRRWPLGGRRRAGRDALVPGSSARCMLKEILDERDSGSDA